MNLHPTKLKYSQDYKERRIIIDTGVEKKFCCKCGAELDVNASFCPNCGDKCNSQVLGEPNPFQQYNMNINRKINLKDKVDIKKTVLSNVIPVGCLAVGVILLITGLCTNVPSDYINLYSIPEYVGGDAYNYIIEACIRGGEIAAAQISKCIYIGVGLLVSCMSALKINVVKPTKENDQGGCDIV